MIKGKIRKNHSDKFKAKVALEAIKNNKTVNELSHDFAVTAKQIYKWRDCLLKKASILFSDKRSMDYQKNEVEQLHKVIGKLTVENDFLANVFNRLK